MSRSPRLKIVVVGAGVSGCVLSKCLGADDRIDLTCLEQVDRHHHKGAGTGLNIGPNAVHAISRADPGLAALLDGCSLPWLTWKMHLADGRTLFEVSLPSLAGRPGWRISWSDLYETLRTEAGPWIHFGASITKMAQGADGRLSVEWSESGVGHSISDIDLLIAADGRFSKTRRMFDGVPATCHLGVVIFRMLVPDTSHGLINDHEQWFAGPNRLLAFRVKPDFAYIAGTFPIEPDQEISIEAKDPAFLRQTYMPAGPVAPAVEWLTDQICANASQIHWARMQEHEILYASKKTPILYVGDASHGMIPTLGQGATQAFEDASVIASWIRTEVTRGNLFPCKWLRQLDELRKDRMRFVMGFSREASDTLLADSDVASGSRRKMQPEFLRNLRMLFCGSYF